MSSIVYLHPLLRYIHVVVVALVVAKYPLDPLLAAAQVERTVPQGGWAHGEQVVDGSRAALCELLGVSRRTIVRWKVSGVPEGEADRAACLLGVHPCDIWPEWFDGAVRG